MIFTIPTTVTVDDRAESECFSTSEVAICVVLTIRRLRLDRHARLQRRAAAVSVLGDDAERVPRARRQLRHVARVEVRSHAVDSRPPARLRRGADVAFLHDERPHGGATVAERRLPADGHRVL